jgi:hypothetical protein
VAQGVPGRLRSRIFSTFGTTRVVGRQPNAPAAFTAGENPGTHFQRLSRPQGKEPRKKSQVTPPGINPGTVRLVAQLWIEAFWVISVYFNIRNMLPKSDTFLPGHPVCVCVCIYIYIFYCRKRKKYFPPIHGLLTRKSMLKQCCL